MWSALKICLSAGKIDTGGRIVLITILVIVISSPWYCSASCNKKRALRWRSDGRCGDEFPLADGRPSQCNPNGERSCCSDYGFCGNSHSHCFCPNCFDFRSKKEFLYVVGLLAKRRARLKEGKYQMRPGDVIQKPVCYYSFNEESGYLRSPNYPQPFPSNQECCYDIQRQHRQYCGVGLLIEDIDMGREDDDDFCNEDWLTLPSCAPQTRICGNKTERYFQYLFQPRASAIRLSFQSKDNFSERRGFRIKYEMLKTCPGPYQTQDLRPSTIPGTKDTCYTKIGRTKGQFNSPFYPNPYPSDLDCVYEFKRKSPLVCGIQMKSVKFLIEEPISTPFGGACKDFLHIPSCWFLCGKQQFSWIVEFQPGAKSMLLHFHSDPSNQNKTTPGFYINFEQVTDCP